MSRLKERTERNCLNCNTEVQGRYCHNCGQENIETKETVWHLVSHFFRDITHFDGKFFSTLKYLIIRPGFLSREYMIGRRASYVNPVRMYIFTSAFFFLLFFNFFNNDKKSVNQSMTINNKTLDEINSMDSVLFAEFTTRINREDGKPDLPMTREEFRRYYDSTFKKAGFNITGTNYKSKAEYDSLLKAGVKKHNWLQRLFIYKVLAVKDKYKNDSSGLFIAVRNSLMHSIPQMLFISLPLLALLLKLLYMRRKDFFYVNHAVFSVHLYIFIFISLLFFFSLNELNKGLAWDVFSYINTLLYLLMFFYTYKAMRKFYGQRRGKTILKYFILLLSFFVVMLLLFTFFILFSFFTI